MSVRILIGDVRTRLAEVPDASVHTCVTSPPYFGLRDYGHDGQIGLEATPDAFVAELVSVFREVKRVLRDDGTLWLNLGDSYTGAANSGAIGKQDTQYRASGLPPKSGAGLKPKDLIGIPWRVAFALQADGWYLRSDIIWHKPNPMPESVTDRPTKAHEYLFLFAKGQSVSRVIQIANVGGEVVHFGKHVGSQESGVREPVTKFCVRLASALFDGAQRQHDFSLPPFYAEEWKQGANGGDGPLVGSHPDVGRLAALSARLLSADLSTKDFLQECDGMWLNLSARDAFLVGGVQPLLGTPAVHVDADGTVTVHDAGEVCKFEFGHGRIVTTRTTTCNYYYDADAIAEPVDHPNLVGKPQKVSYHDESAGRNDGDRVMIRGDTRNRRSVWTVPTAPFRGAHFATFPPALIEPCILAGCPKDGTVLDPFGGAGTTGLVADRLGRNAILCELNSAYAKMAEDRIRSESPMFADVEAA